MMPSSATFEKEIRERAAAVAAEVDAEIPDEKAYRRELRGARRLARELHLWATNPEKAREYQANRLIEDLVEAMAESLGMTVLYVRQMMTAQGFSIADPAANALRWELPTYGWVLADTGKWHVARAWIVNREARFAEEGGARPLFESTCSRTLAPAGRGTFEDAPMPFTGAYYGIGAVCGNCYDDGGESLSQMFNRVPRIRTVRGWRPRR